MTKKAIYITGTSILGLVLLGSVIPANRETNITQNIDEEIVEDPSVEEPSSQPVLDNAEQVSQPTTSPPPTPLGPTNQDSEKFTEPETASNDSDKTSPPVSSTEGSFYTSSHYSAKYYYPGECSAWEGLSPTYLKKFSTLNALLATYPSRKLSPQCD